jgi:hypothetical protein
MARAEVDEAKVARLMEVMERNIEAEIASERIVGIYIPGVSPKPKKVDRKLERTLKAEPTIAEIVEFDRRRRRKRGRVGKPGIKSASISGEAIK